MRFFRSPKATYERRHPRGSLPLEYHLAIDIIGLREEATAREYRLADWGLAANDEARSLRTALLGVLEFIDEKPEFAKGVAQNAFDAVRDKHR